MGLLAMLRSKVQEDKAVEAKKEAEDPISLLRRKILCALEYTGNYQEVLLENGKIVEVEKMEKFARDRVRDALVHAGFIVPPSPIFLSLLRPVEQRFNIPFSNLLSPLNFSENQIS